MGEASMAIVGRQILRDLCKALGIDPSLVRKLTLEVPFDDVVTVTVERLVVKDQADAVTRVLTEHHAIK